MCIRDRSSPHIVMLSHMKYDKNQLLLIFVCVVYTISMIIHCHLAVSKLCTLDNKSAVIGAKLLWNAIKICEIIVILD